MQPQVVERQRDSPGSIQPPGGKCTNMFLGADARWPRLMYDRVKRNRSRWVAGRFGGGARYRRFRLPSTAIADALGVDRSTISLWLNEPLDDQNTSDVNSHIPCIPRAEYQNSAHGIPGDLGPGATRRQASGHCGGIASGNGFDEPSGCAERPPRWALPRSPCRRQGESSLPAKRVVSVLVPAPAPLSHKQSIISGNARRTGFGSGGVHGTPAAFRACTAFRARPCRTGVVPIANGRPFVGLSLVRGGRELAFQTRETLTRGIPTRAMTLVARRGLAARIARPAAIARFLRFKSMPDSAYPDNGVRRNGRDSGRH